VSALESPSNPKDLQLLVQVVQELGLLPKALLKQQEVQGAGELPRFLQEQLLGLVLQPRDMQHWERALLPYSKDRTWMGAVQVAAIL
jgi:hypothetical protein